MSLFDRWNNILKEGKIGPEDADAQSYWHLDAEELNEADGKVSYRKKYPESSLYNQTINLSLTIGELDALNNKLKENYLEEIEEGDNWVSADDINFIVDVLGLDKSRVKEDRNTVVKVSIDNNQKIEEIKESFIRRGGLLNEARLDYYTQLRKMRQWMRGERGFNARAASVDKLLMNLECCCELNFHRGILEILNELQRKGASYQIPQRTIARINNMRIQAPTRPATQVQIQSQRIGIDLKRGDRDGFTGDGFDDDF